MSENPYQAPAVGEKFASVDRGPQFDWLGVAHLQRRLSYCIAIHIFTYVAPWLAVAISPKAHLITGLILLIVFLTYPVALAVGGMTAVILAWKIRHPAIGALLGICSFIPYLGLFTLLMINSKTSGILEQNGIPMGLFGARDLSPIYEAMAQERLESFAEFDRATAERG